MITRREFISLSAPLLVFAPVLGCHTKEDDTDVSWFLSEQEIMSIGKFYAAGTFSSIDMEILLINGWVLTLTEADVCKKKFLERA